MSRTEHFLVVPAFSDQAGQMRVVSCHTTTEVGRDFVAKSPLGDYRAHPHHWREAGLVSSQGKLVCLSAPDTVVNELKECEPIPGGFYLRAEVQ